jgi:GAF domain-containing protein
MPCDAPIVFLALQEKAAVTTAADALAETLVDALRKAVPQSSWVGVYWLRGQELVLGPYLGPPTEHTRIPVGVGVCGTAVSEDEDQVVPDVRQVRNYLSCSPRVRSEIVVLIRCRGQVVGQIDMDSEQVNAFTPDDHCVLKAVADTFGGLLAMSPEPVPPGQ